MNVNENFINSILGPLIGGADIDEDVEKYQYLNPNNESDVKNIIQDVIKSEFENKTLKYKELLKQSLAYYLTTDKVDFQREFDSCLIAFEHPNNPKDFFIWLWEVLFPHESYILKNWKDYKEVNDIDEPSSSNI